MSIVVDVTDVPGLVRDRWGFLVIGADDPGASPKVLSLRPAVRNTELAFDVGSGGMWRRADAASVATFVVAPDGVGEFGEYSLIIDGSIDTMGDVVSFTPTAAVWHRPAPPAPSSAG
ncbi:MAG: hypothetical protein O3A89_04490 [Actinomycetota bacterium]|jgi:hypothetical protein|nr:hypothetical protein [Actinomycetota bacterium]